jgi:hypothetical protein
MPFYAWNSICIKANIPAIFPYPGFLIGSLAKNPDNPFLVEQPKSSQKKNLLFPYI